ATIDTLSLRADGLIDMEGDTPRLDGELIASLRGLTLTDETVSAAVGEDATLTSTFALPGDGTLRLDTVRLEGAGLQATANAQFDGLGAGFELDGRASVEVPDLSRFAAIAGRDALSGALSADLTGSGAPLGGAFDLTFNGATTDVTLGIPQADAMLTGRTDLAIEAARGAEGIELRALDLSNPQISAKGTGALQSNAAALDLTAAVTDLGLLVPQMPGPAELSADLAHDNAVWLGQMRFDGPDGAFADLAGEVTDTLGADVTLSAELPGLERFVPQLAGAATLNGMVTRDADSGEVQGQLRLAGPQDLSADIDGTINADNEAEIDVAAALSTLEAFVPQLEGAAELGGQIRADLDAQSAETDLRLTGPDDILAEVKGKLAMDGPTDLGIIAEMPMLERFVPQLPGLARVTAELTRTNATADWIADLNIEAPQEIRASADASLAVDGKTDVDLTATLARLETFVPQLPGAALLTLRADRAAGMQDWTTDLRIDAPQEIAAQLAGIADPAGAFDMRLLADVPRLQTFLPQLVGRARLTGDVTRTLAGDWTGQSRLTAPTGITADVSGTASETGPIDASYSATVPELQRLVPQLPGPANLRGGVARDDSGQIWSGTLSLNGPEAIVAKVDGDFDVAGAAALSYSATVPGLERLVPQLPGTARLDGQVDRATQDTDWIVSTRLEAPQNIAAAVDGSVDPDGAVSISYDATIERLQAFVPQLVGALTLTGAADRDPNGTNWTGETRLTGPGGIAASLDGTLDEDGDADLTFDATVPGVERFVPDFPGTLTTQGTAQRNASVWTLDAETRAPGNTQAQVSGTFNETAGTADMTAQGSVQLGTANAFIAPNSIQGQANFDVALQGAPQLDAVSGQITTSNASIALPQIQNAINNFGGTVALDGGRAQIDFGGGLRTGGRFTVVGPVDLAVPFNGSIDVAMQDLVLTDNISYETSLGGGLQLAGPLTGGAALSGRIDIAETEFNIATAGGAPGSAPVPEMQHIGESSAAFRTRQNAGLVVEEDEDDGGDGGGPAIGLDVLISAPNRIFVRGRGLESELGGQIRIQGSTANIRPSGAIELIRGHLSIFARRIELTRGIVSLQGSLEPTLDFAATTNTSEGDATLTIEGSVDAPKIEVTADPERPTEEALAMLVFGDQFSKLSPLKVAQLAASLARLQGAGGGANTAAREGLGVDSVDLTTDEDGNAAVGVGAYVSDNIYTDVTVNARGDSEVNINLDVTDSFTVKGSVDNESNTSLGIFFERDY
ncbi:MAG: translocation/assembly module TamB domain-containing protein, partial [Pseudomonadota bacterium]